MMTHDSSTCTITLRFYYKFSVNLGKLYQQIIIFFIIQTNIQYIHKSLKVLQFLDILKRQMRFQTFFLDLDSICYSYQYNIKVILTIKKTSLIKKCYQTLLCYLFHLEHHHLHLLASTPFLLSSHTQQDFH